MLKELKQLWKEIDLFQKILFVLFLPLGIILGLIYGLWLLFWNRYGIAFVCAVILLQPTDTPEEGWQRGQAVALLVALVFLIVKSVRK